MRKLKANKIEGPTGPNSVDDSGKQAPMQIL